VNKLIVVSVSLLKRRGATSLLTAMNPRENFDCLNTWTRTENALPGPPGDTKLNMNQVSRLLDIHELPFDPSGLSVCRQGVGGVGGMRGWWRRATIHFFFISSQRSPLEVFLITTEAAESR
jgi:hypothetical protein